VVILRAFGEEKIIQRITNWENNKRKEKEED